MGGGPIEELETENDQTFPMNPSLKRPIVTTMATSGALGAVCGSMFGYGALLGGTAGAFLGASVASREDETGVKVREGMTSLSNKLNDSFQRNDFAQDVSKKIDLVVRELQKTEEKYKFGQKFNSAATVVFTHAKPHVDTMVEKVTNKVLEADTRGYIPKAQQYCEILDDYTGFSRSMNAVKKELTQNADARSEQ